MPTLEEIVGQGGMTLEDIIGRKGFSKPKTAFQQQAASRKAGIGVEQAAATMESEIGTAKGKAAGDIAQGVVLGGATLATGGLATGPAMAAMGTAGLGGGAIGEMLKGGFGSEDVPKSPKALAGRLGLETVLSAAGEGGARAIGQSLKYLGKEEIPSLIMRSAAKAEAGQQKLVTLQQDSFSQLRDFVRSKGTPLVDVGGDLKTFFDAIGERATGTSKAFKEASKPLFAKLAKAGGGALDKQPLDALMEIKSDLSHVAYKVKGMNTDELVALRNLTESVDAKIVKNLDSLGGSAAKKVYSGYKAFTEQLKKDDAAVSLAEGGIKKLLGKSAGYIPGVDAAIDSGIRGKAAPWLLEHLFSSEKTAALVSKAIKLEAVGNRGAAQSAFDAAINTSGVGTLVKGWMKPPPQENPNAAQEK